MGGSSSTLSSLTDGSEEGYHVLSVYENSPGADAKLQAYFDFIIAVGKFRDPHTQCTKLIPSCSINTRLSFSLLIQVRPD